VYLSALESGAGQGQLGNGAITPKDARCMADQIKKNVSADELQRDIDQNDKDFLYDAIRENTLRKGAFLCKPDSPPGAGP
jgi:hypothetical protein